MFAALEDAQIQKIVSAACLITSIFEVEPLVETSIGRTIQ